MKNEHLLAGFVVFVAAAFIFTWFYISSSRTQILGAFELAVLTNPVTAILAVTFVIALMFIAIAAILNKR